MNTHHLSPTRPTGTQKLEHARRSQRSPAQRALRRGAHVQHPFVHEGPEPLLTVPFAIRKQPHKRILNVPS